MSMTLPFECDHEAECATRGKDPRCANRDACHMPTCPGCGAEMVVEVIELDSAGLPEGLSWMRYACPACERREEAGL